MNAQHMTLANIGVATPVADDRQVCGEIYLANEARFTATNFSEPLTAYAVGWDDPSNILETLDLLFPAVQVSRRFEFKKTAKAASFLSESDDIRAIGSPFKRVEYKGSSVNEKTFNKGLTIRLDHDDRMAGDQEQAVSRLMQRLHRNDLRRGVALIIAAATNTAKTWDTTANKNPDMDVLQDLDTGGDTRGLDSNMVVYGRGAWIKRVLSYEAQDLAGQGGHARMSMADVAAWLGADVVTQVKERYASTATAKTKVLGSYVLMYMAEQLIGKDDPSDVKRFWTPTDSGRVRVYVQEHSKYTDVTVEMYSNIVITGNNGVRMFTVS